MYVASSEQMRRADRLAIEKYGVSSLTLMENAGAGAFEVLKRRIPDLHQKKVVVVAGRGNNGGDGRVIARLLQGAAGEVRLLEIESFQGSSLGDCDIIVDAIFGTGLSRDVGHPEKGIIEAINAAGKWVLALDIPSGLSADTGRSLGVAVRADLTVTMGLPKLGLVMPSAADLVGDLEVVDIGIPPEALRELGLTTHWVTAEEVAPLFSPRPKTAHKGSYGHLLLVGGSATKPGAILMAGRAALRTGAGLVTVALPDKAFRKIPRGFLELMYEPLPSTSSGTLSRKGLRKLGRLMEGKSVVAAGPGLGVNVDTRAIVAGLLKQAVPMVLDADALNCLAVKGEAWAPKPLRDHIVLTPHPGEMARLIGSTVKKIQSDRIGTARGFAEKYGAVVVLKGFRTVTAVPSGEVFINSTGNPGMATAGMGDVLTGIIGSLLAQGMEFEKAIVAGVWLHGRAGDRVAARLGDRGLLAGDLIEEIPLTIRELAKNAFL